MNILFGLCGAGKRFRDVGYTIPKYIIDVNGSPMIEHAVKTLKILGDVFFIVLKEHIDQYPQIKDILSPMGTIIVSEFTTQGAAQTLLLAKDYIDLTKPLISANGDQYLDWDSSCFNSMLCDYPNTSYILTYKENDTKCSYIKKNEKGDIIEVREKQVISNDATVGVYHWASASDFFKDAETMIAADYRENGEYYVAPVYNYSIKRGLQVKNYELSDKEFWPIGTPNDLENFLKVIQPND